MDDMKTYAQSQRKAEQSRAIAHEALQRKKKAKMYTQEGSISDFARVNGVIQGAFKVKESKIVQDIEDEELCPRVFTKATKDWIEQKKSEGVIWNEKFIKDNRGLINFEQLSPNKAINNSDEVIKWLDKNKEEEHIYLYKDSTIYGGISGSVKSSNKNPHPTILGGDPEVDFAGIMSWKINESGKKSGINIDNRSGHYLPPIDKECGGAVGKLGGIASHHAIIGCPDTRS